jgi:hypothetical protein
MYRHHPSWLEVVRLVRSGRIGRLQAVQSWFSYFNDDPTNIRNRLDAGGGAMMDIGCYNIHVARLLYGEEPSKIESTVRRDPVMGIDVLSSAAEGLPAFLRQLVACSEDYARDRDTLQQEVCTPQIQLPSLPPRLLWEPIWEWLEPHRTRFDRVIHGAYGHIGHLLLKPFRRSEEQLEGSFRVREWEAYHQAVQRILDNMRLLREVGSPRVQQAVQQALSGTQQEHLLTELRVQYDKLPVVSDGFRRYVGQLLDEFAQTSPHLMRGIQYGLVATAVLRPAVTVGLFALPGAELSSYVAAQAAMESAQRALDVAGTEAAKAAASHMVQEAAAQTAQHSITAVGVHAAVAVTAEGVAEGGRAATLRQLLARIAQGYYQERATCLTAIVSQHVTGSMLDEIEHLARVGQSEPLQRAELLLSELRTALVPNSE